MADLTLHDLLDAPERALDLDPLGAAAALAKVEGLAAVLRLAASKGNGQSGHEPEPSDRMLTPQEVGERLGLKVEQVYRRAARWGFTRRPSKGTLRFSERGLDRFMAGKRG